MTNVISNTSPLFYLHQINGLSWLPMLFDEVWTTTAVVSELTQGIIQGYGAPNVSSYQWIQVVDAKAIPSEWLSLDIGAGELAVLALALENPDRVLLIDDQIGRRLAQAAGLSVWGTLRVILEAKSRGLIPLVAPQVTLLAQAGMWISDDIHQRILLLAGERLLDRSL